MNKKLVIIGIIAIFLGLVLITISQNTMAAQTRTVDPQIRNAYPLFGCSGNQPSEANPNQDTRTQEGIEAEMCRARERTILDQYFYRLPLGKSVISYSFEGIDGSVDFLILDSDNYYNMSLARDFEAIVYREAITGRIDDEFTRNSGEKLWLVIENKGDTSVNTGLVIQEKYPIGDGGWIPVLLGFVIFYVGITYKPKTKKKRGTMG
jgi:hypothetical protein|tara:strand:+ start:1124 stop:1744 length:621 start_codon:yes stop_codon:yes gene_type:complete